MTVSFQKEIFCVGAFATNHCVWSLLRYRFISIRLGLYT